MRKPTHTGPALARRSPAYPREFPAAARASATRAYVEAAGWGGPNMWFVQVPEPKTAKNRMHFDLRAPGEAAAEVRRLAALGASVIRRDTAHSVRPLPGRQTVRALDTVDVTEFKKRVHAVRRGAPVSLRI